MPDDNKETNDEEHIVRYTAKEIEELIARGESKTDWARVDAMTDEDIERAIAEDPDWADFKDIDWANATIVVPGKPHIPLSDIWNDFDPAKNLTKTAISIRIDADVLEFFRSKGKGWQTSINMVLRHYMNTQNRK